MKKKVLKSRIVALATMLTLTAQAQAEDYSLWINGVQVTSENQDNITEEEEDAAVSFDPQTCTLTLNSAYLSCDSGNLIESGLDSLVVFFDLLG